MIEDGKMGKRKGNMNGNFINITNNKKMENDIFQIILKHIEDLIYIMKVDNPTTFRYMFANENALKQARLTPDYIDKTLQEVLPKDISTHIQEHYERVIRKRSVVSFQDKIILLDGNEAYGESILTPIYNEDSVICYVVSITRDITDRMIEKRKLIESTERYKSLVDHNLDVVFSLDLNGKLLHANPATFNIMGYREKQLNNCTIVNLLDDRDVATFSIHFQETLLGNAREFVGCRIKHRNGTTILVHLKMIPIVVNTEITGIFVILKDITEQSSYEKMMKYMAFHDQLTALPNRSALKENLVNFISIAKKFEEQLAVMYIDLDRFKSLNDTLGHNVGDVLLKEVAERLLNIDGEGYSVYRQGGDEFVVILQNTNKTNSSRIAEEILTSIQKPFLFGTHEYFISTSIGISTFPNDGEDGETLIKNADTALYRVKERGKGHYQYYSTDMQKSTSQTMLLETGLRKAIDRYELILYYQPQVDVLTGEVTSFEALIRWNHPELGFISPANFIPLAEEIGLILPIGEWVINTVCKKLRQWQDNGYRSVTVAINLSPKQFQQPCLVEYIQKAIAENNIDPKSLEFEITEGAIQDSREAILILNRLKELGVQVAVDDFGTGFSSLNYLKHFPIDTLKIDQSFIKDVLVDRKDMAITTTIIHLAQSLGLSVVAEGVEEAKQLEFLKIMKCDKAQGYFFSKPVCEQAIEEHYLNRY